MSSSDIPVFRKLDWSWIDTPRRAELKVIMSSPTASLDERMEASRKLSTLPHDSTPVRLRNRDRVDGRPRGCVGKAGVSRIRFREMAHRGKLPGITKSSW